MRGKILQCLHLLYVNYGGYLLGKVDVADVHCAAGLYPRLVGRECFIGRCCFAWRSCSGNIETVKRLSHLKKLCTMPRAQRHNVGKNECMREQQHEVGAMRPWGGGGGPQSSMNDDI